MSKRKNENIENFKEKKIKTLPFSSNDILIKKLKIGDKNA